MFYAKSCPTQFDRNKKRNLMSICTNTSRKIHWVLVHICYEYDKCFWYFLHSSLLTYYHHVIFRFLQRHILIVLKEFFHRCRCIHSLALCYVWEPAVRPDDFLSKCFLILLPTQCSRFDNSTPFFFFACFLR
jgi:hypothetical protein